MIGSLDFPWLGPRNVTSACLVHCTSIWGLGRQLQKGFSISLTLVI
jgi:hypothetical protein